MYKPGYYGKDGRYYTTYIYLPKELIIKDLNHINKYKLHEFELNKNEYGLSRWLTLKNYNKNIRYLNWWSDKNKIFISVKDKEEFLNLITKEVEKRAKWKLELIA